MDKGSLARWTRRHPDGSLGAAIVLGTTAAFETWRPDEGRAPADPIREGADPEAADEIAGHGDRSHST
jgi:undecaprenyl-diphosphatase